MIRHQGNQGMIRRYAMNISSLRSDTGYYKLDKSGLDFWIAVCAFSFVLIGPGIPSEAAENSECAVCSQKVYSPAWYLRLHSR